MCVTVRALCLLFTSVSGILSVARAVIHDMLYLMVHQRCDPFFDHSAVLQNGHDVGASPRCTALHCTLYTVHCTLYTVHCTLYTVHISQNTVHCTLYTVHCTLYTFHKTHTRI